MAVEWCREIPRERSASGEKEGGNQYSRAFLVRVDAFSTPIDEIYNAPGLSYGDLHPDDDTVELQSFDCKVADDNGLLYLVSFKYAKKRPDDSGGDEGGGGGGGGQVNAHIPFWGASSSVTTRAVYQDRHGKVMCNSAGDPFDAQEADVAEAKLSYTEYWPSHTDWNMSQRTYTNTVNLNTWNGGDRYTWKCQGCSAKVNIENENGVTTVYWEVTWEFAYRAEGWQLKPWDVGFSELVDNNGTPSPTSTGYNAATGEGPSGGGTKRAQIKGQDKKAVRQPVALSNGVAKPAGSRPNAIWFEVYETRDFTIRFGQLTTPGFGAP